MRAVGAEGQARTETPPGLVHGPERWPERWGLLLDALWRVHDEAGRALLLASLLAPTAPRVLAFANAHALNLAARDGAFFQDLLRADVLLRDGQGMAWLLRLLRQRPGLNLHGTGLIPRLLAHLGGTQPQAGIALFGTREPWLSRARRQVAQLAPDAPCLLADGFQSEGHYLRLLARASPRLVILAMGMPRQERLALALREAASSPCLIVCGGAILDFLGGRCRRAPAGVQALGLEWAWRLGLEPRRLAGRYVLGNPLFMARALRLALSAAAPRSSSTRS